MNQKKCPKCSELNPQEAVMCWACYTPLGGGVAGSAAATTAAATATATAAARASTLPAGDSRAKSDKSDKKKAVAPWQIAVIVVGLLMAGGVSFMMMGGGGDPEEENENTIPNKPPDKNGLPVPGPVRGPGAPTGVTQGPQGPVAPMPPQNTNAPSFTITTSPGRRASWATVGIMPNTSVTDAQAAALAKVAYQQVARGRNFEGAYVYVFADRNAASTFQTFQRSKRGAPLGPNDYVSLAELWPSTPVRYEYNNGNEEVRYPKLAPSDWWSRESRYTKARD